MKLKYFDIYQKILLGIGVLSISGAFIFQSLMNMQAIITYDDQGLIASIEYPFVLQTIYTIFFFLNIFCIAWFIIRSISYSARQLEAIE